MAKAEEQRQGTLEPPMLPVSLCSFSVSLYLLRYRSLMAPLPSTIYQGDPEQLMRAERLMKGIPLPMDALHALAAQASQLGVSLPPSLLRAISNSKAKI